MIRLPPLANDNVFTRQLYEGEANCLPHIPKARYLIDRYISAYWKHDRDDLDYVHMELTLCRYMLDDIKDPIFRKLNVKWVARVLNVSPLRLFNDPNLPF